MDILKALKIFKIEDISNIDKSKIKKTFKVLMKNNHPDIGGNEENAKLINIAYRVILDNIDMLENINNEIENKVCYNCIIPFEKLIDIYNGDNITLNKGRDTIVINKATLRSHNVILETKIRIVHNGMAYDFKDYVRVNNKDEYTIVCKINSKDNLSPEEVRLIGYGLNESITISYKSLTRRIKLDNQVYLNVIIDRIAIEI